tara:strand:+ start:286 stop:606 length:321 start_codon:yes stop_codon:yes gene_type:complete
MASGILGQSAPSATTNTSVYTVPANTLSVVNVSVLNRSASATADVRIALASGASPSNGEYIEYDITVPPKGIIERTGLALQAGKVVVVYSSTNDTSVTVTGLEQAV